MILTATRFVTITSTTPNQTGDTGIVQVIPEGGPDSPQMEALVASLRALHDTFQEQDGVNLAVTGYTAAGMHRSAPGIGENGAMDIAGQYRHYKGGLYEVVGIARHSETEEKLVVYRAPAGSLWVRPHTMFFEDVLVNGNPVARFARIP